MACHAGGSKSLGSLDRWQVCTPNCGIDPESRQTPNTSSTKNSPMSGLTCSSAMALSTTWVSTRMAWRRINASWSAAKPRTCDGARQMICMACGMEVQWLA